MSHTFCTLPYYQSPVNLSTESHINVTNELQRYGCRVYILQSMKCRRPIYEWPETQRPRERALDEGVESLSDSELLALIIAKGTAEHSAVQLGEALIQRFGSLGEIARRNPVEFMEIPGIGKAKAAAISAAFEMGRRAHLPDKEKVILIGKPSDVHAYMAPRIAHLPQETFWVLLLNTRGRLLRAVKISEGTLNATVAHPRDVFRTAIAENAASIVLVHNHPGGDSSPSPADVELTHQLVKAGDIFDIKVVDHVIITTNGYFSTAEKMGIP